MACGGEDKIINRQQQPSLATLPALLTKNTSTAAFQSKSRLSLCRQLLFSMV